MALASLLALVQFIRTKRSRHNGRGNPRETFVVITRVSAKSTKRLVHSAVSRLGNDALRLLDNDATGEGVFELLVERVGVEQRAVLQDGDRRHVGEALRGDVVVVVCHRSLQRAKEVERTNGTSPQSQGKAVHRVEAVLDRRGVKRGQRSFDSPSATLTTGEPVR